MTVASAVASGIRSSNRSGRMIALLYVVNLLFAGIVPLAFAPALLRALRGSLAGGEMLRQPDFTVLHDFLANAGDGVAALLDQLLWIGLLYLLVTVFLSAGMLTTLLHGARTFTLRGFFEACGHYAGRMLRLFALMTAVAAAGSVLLLLSVALIHVAVAGGTPSETTLLSAIAVDAAVLLLGAAVLVTVADYARVAVVARDGRSVRAALRDAVRFLARNPLPALGLQLVLGVTAAALPAAALVLEASVPMDGPWAILAVLGVHQSVVAARIWLRVAGAAAQIRLFEERTGRAVVGADAPAVYRPAWAD